LVRRVQYAKRFGRRKVRGPAVGVGIRWETRRNSRMGADVEKFCRRHT